MDIQSKSLNQLVDKIKKRVSSLDKRQKTILVLLIFALFFNFYVNKLAKPQFINMRRLRAEAARLNSQVDKLKAQMPDLAKEKILLDQALRDNRRLRDRLGALEKQLPVYSRIPQLLGILVKEAQDYEVDLISVKPKGTKADQQYSRLDIEMQFNTTYYSLTNYLARLESLSQFLSTTDLVLEEPKEAFFESGITTTMVLSTILSPSPPMPGTLTQEPAPLQPAREIDVERNPFAPQENIAGYIKKSKYVLSGITYSGENSTAIINGKVYRIRDYL
ncbi:MAG: type 4a pilus biogenesis protein PilO, partial [Candidatus Omnitrophota bacterium]